MKPAPVVGILVIVVFALFGAGAFKKSLTPYVEFAEARRSARTVQVRGTKDPASVRFDDRLHALRFDLTNAAHERLPVVYRHAKPGNFDQADELVVIGRFRNGVFECSQMIVKCPSKYQAKEAAGEKSPH